MDNFDMNDIYGIYTSFIYNNKEYYIIYDYYENYNDGIVNKKRKTKIIHKFRNALNDNNIDFYNNSFYFNPNKHGKNTLYIKYEYI